MNKSQIFMADFFYILRQLKMVVNLNECYLEVRLYLEVEDDLLIRLIHLNFHCAIGKSHYVAKVIGFSG